MYKKGLYTIKSNKQIAKQVFEMILEGDTSYISAPGQFINIELEGFYLRRPISICEYGDNFIKIIYKVVGLGTEALSKMKNCDRLDILTGLGNGFNIDKSGDRPLLIGGGVGTPPMYELCKELINNNKLVTVVLGFNSKEDVFYEEEFKKLGANVLITTVDGSYGIKGFVTDAINEEYSYYYACGPIPMLKAVYSSIKSDGELSLEERMGCGFGACMGCTCKTKTGPKRLCQAGPVLKKEEIVW